MKDNKSWTELFLYSVYNRLCNFSSHKADISILLNARWQWVQDTGHDKQGYTKQGCFIHVLELIEGNGLEDNSDLLPIEWGILLN